MLNLELVINQLSKRTLNFQKEIFFLLLTILGESLLSLHKKNIKAWVMGYEGQS